MVAAAGGWQYSGPGLVLNNSREAKTIVLELSSEGRKGGVGLDRTDKARELGYKDISALYDGWFDVIEPAAGPTPSTTSIFGSVMINCSNYRPADFPVCCRL